MTNFINNAKSFSLYGFYFLFSSQIIIVPLTIRVEMAISNLVLIPWDAESPAHQEWLIKQREACGWHQEYVATKWKSEQLKGLKCIFWIVSYNPDSVKSLC